MTLTKPLKWTLPRELKISAQGQIPFHFLIFDLNVCIFFYIFCFSFTALLNAWIWDRPKVSVFLWKLLTKSFPYRKAISFSILFDIWPIGSKKQDQPEMVSGIFFQNCFNDWEKLLKFEAEGWEFVNILRSGKQFIQTVKGQNNIW